MVVLMTKLVKYYNIKMGACFAHPLLHPFCINPLCSYTHCMQCHNYYVHVNTAMKRQTLLLRRGHSIYSSKELNIQYQYQWEGILQYVHLTVLLC